MLAASIDDFVEKTKYKLERTLNKNKRNQLHITDNNLKNPTVNFLFSVAANLYMGCDVFKNVMRDKRFQNWDTVTKNGNEEAFVQTLAESVEVWTMHNQKSSSTDYCKFLRMGHLDVYNTNLLLQQMAKIAADPNGKKLKEKELEKKFKKDTFTAILGDNVQELDKLLEGGKKLSTIADGGMSLLSMAKSRGKEKCSAWLEEHNVQGQFKENYMAKHRAMHKVKSKIAFQDMAFQKAMKNYTAPDGMKLSNQGNTTRDGTPNSTSYADNAVVPLGTATLDELEEMNADDAAEKKTLMDDGVESDEVKIFLEKEKKLKFKMMLRRFDELGLDPRTRDLLKNNRKTKYCACRLKYIPSFIVAIVMLILGITLIAGAEN